MTNHHLVGGCFVCGQQAAVALPPCEDVGHTEHETERDSIASAIRAALDQAPTGTAGPR